MSSDRSVRSGSRVTLEQPLPADTEARLASFTELVATAIANADSRAELMAAARGSSRPRMTLGGGSNVTCTTAPSSSW